MTTTHPPTATSDERIESHLSERAGYVDANHNLGGTISVTVSVPKLGTAYFEAVTRALHPSTARALGRKLLALADECDPPATAAVARRSPEGVEPEQPQDFGEERFSGQTEAPPPIGYFVWTEAGGYAFKNKLHATPEAAEQARASVVWHNRHQYAVRPIYLGSALSSPTREPTP